MINDYSNAKIEEIQKVTKHYLYHTLKKRQDLNRLL